MMTTCPTCGSDTAAGATCVVCGADPTTSSDPADPGRRDEVAAVAAGGGPTSPGGEDVDPRARTTPATDDWPSNTARGDGRDPDRGDGSRDESASRQDRPDPLPPPAGGPAALPPPSSSGSGAAGPAWPALAPPSPDAVAVSESSRNWGMLAHLSALVAAGLGGLSFLGPLVVWLVRKDQDRFVAHHAVEALNFNLSLMLYTVLAVLLGLTIVGLVVAIPAAIVGFFVWFITSIVAAVKAQRGEGYRYPLTIRLVRE